MEVITSSLLRKFLENLREQSKTILTVPSEQSPRKYNPYIHVEFYRHYRGTIVDWSWCDAANSKNSSSNSFKSWCWTLWVLNLCSWKRYYRFTRKINYQEHFKKHSIGKKFSNIKTTMKLFQEISTMVTGIFLACIFVVLLTRFSSSPTVNLLNGLKSLIRRW